MITRYFEVRNKDDIILITEFGKWTVLSKEEYEEFLKKGKDAEKKTLDKLRSAFIILDKDNAKTFFKYLNIRYGFFSIPMVSVQINLTYECNLSCIYCHANSKQRDMKMDEDVLKDVALFINNLPRKYIYVEFQGGEPLLAFDKMQQMVELMKKIGKKQIAKVVVTNLTLIDDDIARFLEKNKFGVMGSIDVNEEIHNIQRPLANGRGSFDKAYHGFVTLLERKMRMDTRATITKICVEKYGFSGTIEELINNAKKHGLRKINYMPVMPQGKARENENILMNAEEMFKLAKTGIEKCVEEGILDKFAFPYLSNIFSPMRQYSCLRDVCGAGITNITVAPNGEIYPCDVVKRLPEWKIGEIKNGEAKYDLEKLSKWASVGVKNNPLCGYCEWQGLCNLCKACNYQEFGRLTAYHFLSEKCKFHKKFYKYLFENIKILREYYNKFVKIYY